MKHRHTVDQQHQIAAAVVQHFRFTGKNRLLHDLVAALPGGNLHAVVDFQADFLAEMCLVIGVIALDRNRFAVDKAVQLQRRAQFPNLLHNLLHFAIGQGIIAKAVYAAVIVKENVCPVADQILLGGIFQNCALPAFGRQDFYKRFFKVRFLLEGHLFCPFPGICVRFYSRSRTIIRA